ncbi:hypothetical protein D3870_21005 [Noviherbaspirillum cavernae]|uniref:Uncharacterized protein n=1 Tax=Noviherbaspirillum cavernae TaxID=2320862 RepID=A0A418WVV4_9BURK|nr:hypothetical protein [Noviherbaspirillum cavernae]RJF96864.1 hypothetical protein D3870_21005 [Noviherbaspirillum cavernae]
MRKGFGLYSPHEATTFFLKTMLVSFWVGVDLIAALVLSTFSSDLIARHGILIFAVAAILIVGTVFSSLFSWATGSLFARQAGEAGAGSVARTLQTLKREPYQLLGAGAIAVFILLCGTAGYLRSLQKEAEPVVQFGRADATLGKKCSEVARLEKSLFQSDEQFVMAQCLVQYDQQYAALRNTDAHQKR